MLNGLCSQATVHKIKW